MESPAKRIPLALKSSSQLNIQQLGEFGPRPAQGDMRRKRRGLIDDENLDKRRFKRFHLVSMARELLKTEEARKRSASFNDEESHERNPKRFRSSLASESLIDLTARLSFAESTKTYSVLVIFFSIRVLRGFEYISYSLPACRSSSHQFTFAWLRSCGLLRLVDPIQVMAMASWLTPKVVAFCDVPHLSWHMYPCEA